MKKKWSELTTQQLGQIGEYHAKMEFISYGYEIYTPDIDDHGVDFIAKDKAGVFYEVQVKSICRAKYVYIPKDFPVPHQSISLSLPSINARISSNDLSLWEYAS